MVILIDNYDSFTYNLYDYALQAGRDCSVCREDEITMPDIEKMAPAGFIFSPGPEKPENHPLMFEILKKYFKSKPILGICLGHQAIGEFFGAKLIKGEKPMHGKVSEIKHTGHEMFQGIPQQFNVARYHSLILENLDGTELKPTSFTHEGVLMSLAHKNLPIWGVQFHPEAILTGFGMKIIKNWKILVK